MRVIPTERIHKDCGGPVLFEYPDLRDDSGLYVGIMARCATCRAEIYKGRLDGMDEAYDLVTTVVMAKVEFTPEEAARLERLLEGVLA